MRYVFIINRTAGKGKCQEEIKAKIEEYFANKDTDYKIIETEYRGHAEELARKEAETGDALRIFACGGEGTGYEVINGIVVFGNVSYGIIPCGSANDFVRGLGGDKPFLDIENQVDGISVPIDLIKAGDRYSINGCSVGMDAMVARDMILFKNLPLVSGSMAYTLAIVKTFLKKLGVKLKLKVDGEDYGNVSCLFAVIANGAYYGGGYKGAPDAVAFDGKLNFTKVDVISKLSVLKFLGKYKRGEHRALSCCQLKECEEMYFESNEELPVNLDGEIIVTDKMHFSLKKNALEFIVPKSLYKTQEFKRKFLGNNVAFAGCEE